MSHFPWYCHLPSAVPCSFSWDRREGIGQALAEFPWDERVAYWSVAQGSALEAMASKERARVAALPENSGRLL